MRQRGYAIVFMLVLLLACVGGFLGGRFLLARLQQDFGPQAGWTPAATTSTAQMVERPTATAIPVAGQTPLPGPTATMLVVATPVGVPTLALPSLTPTAVLLEAKTETPIPTPAPIYPYALARPVRHSIGDCPGSPQAYVLGQVTDRIGNPLPDVRLYLVDQYGNAATAVSKAGTTDAGRYDFPIGGPARRFFLTVIGADGRQISPQVEIGHALIPDPQATCHWVDWVRR